MRMAVVDGAGLVENVIVVADDGPAFDPGPGRTLVAAGALPVAPGWTFAGETWQPPEPQAPAPDPQFAAARVDIERDRRIVRCFTFAGVAFQLDERSQQRITAMGADARFAIAAGAQAGNLRWADPAADFAWIATDNALVPMDAPTMVAFSNAAKLWVARHTYAARALKDMDPIPADPTNNGYWPEAS